MLPREGNVRFNFVLGVLNGALFMFGSAFVSPTTVLPIFVKNFTPSDTLVGLACSLQRAGWYLPQLFVAGYIERFPYKRRFYLRANSVRLTLIWLFVPMLAFWAVDRPFLVLVGFMALFGSAAVFGGLAGLPFTDMVGKTIPKQHRGPFYALRFFFGIGVLSILAGVIVRVVLRGDGGYSFPVNYVIIFSLAAGLMTIGILCYGFVREPAGSVSSTRRTVVGVLKEIPEILRRDVNYRRLLVARVLSSGIGFSMPFYIVLAREAFGTSESTTGVFLATQTAGAMASNILWGRMSSVRGNRRVIVLSTAGQALIPLYILVLYFVYADTLRLLPMWAVTASFLPAFFLIGATVPGTFVGFNSFLLDIAPEDRRPTYVGISNTVMGGASFLPAVGGVLADAIHLQSVFVASMITGGAAVLTGLRLKDPA